MKAVIGIIRGEYKPFLFDASHLDKYTTNVLVLRKNNKQTQAKLITSVFDINEQDRISFVLWYGLEGLLPIIGTYEYKEELFDV